MIEYHGWLTLRESPSEIDDGGLTNIVELFQEKLNVIRSNSSSEIGLKFINGNCQFWVSGNNNRRTEEFNDIVSLIKEIASLAIGAFGMIYFWDDEDLKLPNDFQVLVIKRGEMVKAADQYLSPCSPIIEDEE